MGQVFELIADQALEKLDEYYNECHICGATDVALYSYQGVLTLDDGSMDDDIYAACATCISSKKLRHAGENEYMQTIKKYVNALDQLTEERKLILVEELISKSRRTPDVPIFLQGVDRPLCCNDIAEFMGYPSDQEELYKIGEQYVYWNKEPRIKTRQLNFRIYGCPESLREVAGFACRHCGKRYFTFQFT